MGIERTVYTQRSWVLMQIRMVLDYMMTERPVVIRRDNPITCDVHRIIVSEENGVFLQDQTEAIASSQGKKSSGGTEVKIFGADYFKNDSSLLRMVTNFIKNYPRLRIVLKELPIARNTTHEEIAFVLVNDISGLYRVGGERDVKLLIEGNRFIQIGLCDCMYERTILYDGRDKHIDMLCSTKEPSLAKQVRSMQTFQGRFKEDRDVALLILSAYEENRCMVADNIMYLRQCFYDERNQGSIKYTPVLNIKDHCRGGVVKCPSEYALNITDLGITVESVNVGQPLGKGADTLDAHHNMNLIKVANIIDNDFSHIGDVIKAIKQNKTGLVLLDDVLPDDIVDAFYYPTNRWVGDGRIVEQETVFGGYGNNVSMCWRNPLVTIHQLKSFKEANTEAALASSGVSNGAYDFYIFPQSAKVDGKMLYELSKRALVFYIASFESLFQAYTLLKEMGNDKLFDVVSYIGDLSGNGVLDNAYLKRLMKNDEIELLKRTPLRIGKETSDGESTVAYRKYIPELLKYNTPKTSRVKSLIISSETKVLSEQGIDSAVMGLTLAQPELNLVISSIFPNDDIPKLLEQMPVVRRQTEIAINDSRIPMRFTFNKYADDKIKATVEPVNVRSELDTTIAKHFMVKGYSLLCGEPSSGKHITIRSICKSVPGRNRILVIDPYSVISELYFGNSEKLDLTIYRGEDANEVRALLSTRPDTIIVYKMPLFSHEMLFAIADQCTPEQQLIIAMDKLFSDFLLSIPMRFMTKLFAQMGVIIDQLRVTLRDGTQRILYEKIDRGTLNSMPMADWADRKNISEWVYKNIMGAAEDGLMMQVNTLHMENRINEEEHARLTYALTRNYKLIQVQDGR